VFVVDDDEDAQHHHLLSGVLVASCLYDKPPGWRALLLVINLNLMSESQTCRWFPVGMVWNVFDDFPTGKYGRVLDMPTCP